MIPAYEDDYAIRRLMAEYCYCLDQQRFADLGALFAEDGTWEARYGKATGPARIADFLTELVPPTPRRRHFITNTLIDIDGGEARSTSYYLVVREFEAGPQVSVAGTYHDTLVRSEGVWKFAYRRLEAAIVGDMGLTR